MPVPQEEEKKMWDGHLARPNIVSVSANVSFCADDKQL